MAKETDTYICNPQIANYFELPLLHQYASVL